MLIAPFTCHRYTDPADALLGALLDLLIAPDTGEEAGEESEDGALDLDIEDDEQGNDVSSGATSRGWETWETTVSAEIQDWATTLLRAVSDSTDIGPAALVARRHLIHHDYGVDILGTCEWRVAFPLRILHHAGWVVLEWGDLDESRTVPMPQHAVKGCVIFGASEERLPWLLTHRLRARTD
jgi:hypothetical protein